MREYERLQLFKEHLEALLVTSNEQRSIFFEDVPEKRLRKVLCSGSESEDLVLSIDHGHLNNAEKERLHSFSEFSSKQIGEKTYSIPLGKDPRRAAGLIEAVFTRIIRAPEDYIVEIRVEKQEDSDADF